MRMGMAWKVCDYTWGCASLSTVQGPLAPEPVSGQCSCAVCAMCAASSITICQGRLCHWSCMMPVGCCRLLAEDDPWAADLGFVAEVVVAAYEKRRAQTEIINAMPLYPTEKLLWDENQVPNMHYTGAPLQGRTACQLAHVQIAWTCPLV